MRFSFSELRTPLALLALSCFALSPHTANALTLTETQLIDLFGNTRGTATPLTGQLTPESNLPSDNVYGFGLINPTATINGAINGVNDIDFFSFIANVGDQYFFDVDGGNFDSTLSLFDSTGTLVARGDDIVLPFDPGSTSISDAFLGVYTIPTTGTYYLAITEFFNRPTAFSQGTQTQLRRPNIIPGETGNNVADPANLAVTGLLAPDETFQGGSIVTTGSYSLHVTLAPEPGTVALAASGLLPLAGMIVRRRRRKA